jgi:TRAP-type C4-dicarboxylate transport system permease large subunit
LNPAARRANPWLLSGAAATALAALAHLACIAMGPSAYLAMGAGPRMAELAEAGHWYPPAITVVIAGMLSVWSAYALSGAGLIRRLPLLRTVLAAITAVFLLRGFARPVLEPYFPGNSDGFWFWSSAICLGIGLAHAIGLVQSWTSLGRKA